MKVWRGFVNAFSYFTILPVPHSEEAPDAYTIGWLPLVGAVVGFAAGWGAYGTYLLTHSQLWCAIAAFALSIVLTGAIHIDGFLDCCDALLATTSVQRRLEILKDAHHGSYAIVGMALLAVVWLASLLGIPAEAMPVALASVGWLSRCATISNIGLYENARTGSRMPKLVLWGLFFGVIAVVMKLALLIVAAFAIALVFAWMLSRRLSGGLTGDVYGALIVITEVGLLKTVSIFPALLR